ncbi:MAG: Maf family protein [Solirubrobacterales bacterium]
MSAGGGPQGGERRFEPLILASGSPRRAELLRGLGVEFEVVVSGAAEVADGDPEAVVAANARAKASAVAARHPGHWVLGSDTEVALDGATLGKPADADAAEATLRRLAGRAHLVLSAICLVEPGGARREGIERTEVTFRPLDEALLARYLASGEWRGKAGSYAIQGLGSCLVTATNGDFSNVVGLPVPLLGDLAPELIGFGRT